MEASTGIGSGIMLALAAGLWLVYLVPSWLRRNEYLATERNALRLQQTLRVLAETTEMPAPLRAEATARSVAEHQRALKRELQQRASIDRHRATAAARLHASTIPEPVARPSATTTAPRIAKKAVAAPTAPTMTSAARTRVRRLRRVRAITSLVLVAAIATAVTQGVFMVTTGAAVASWAVLGFSAVAAMTSVAMLSRLAAVTRSRAVVVEPKRAPVARRVVMSEPLVAETPAEEPTVSWTPVPVPKPLYLGRPATPAITFDASALASQLADAAAEAERALRAAHAEPEVTPIRGRKSDSRFAAMGIVDEGTMGGAGAERPDLNEVLRRRRAAG